MNGSTVLVLNQNYEPLNVCNARRAFVLLDKGKAEILAHKMTGASGDWKYRGPKPSMYQVEHDELFASIRKGEPINNGDYMANSSMIAIMGRMANYTGETITWEQAMASQERLGPATYEWGDVPEPEVAIPGVTKLS